MGLFSLDMWKVRELVPEGLAPKEVAMMYFNAIRDNDADTFLATLAHNQRIYPSSEFPGPYDVCGWHLGREKWRKYKVTYEFIDEFFTDSINMRVLPDEQGFDETENVLLHFSPLFGPVPGFIEGDTLHSREVKGPDAYIRGAKVVKIAMVKEAGEWKIMEVLAAEEPEDFTDAEPDAVKA
mmetsp:Transcript_43502/g.138780  ORF Transcript_43502/g.138780 Transcript_43502/m.138780 type:complete len:181 (+) Transcript_43502:130-672(+)